MSELVERLHVALAGRYDVERELGAGGMATVYLAQDLRHGRRVAIKVLRPELAAVIGAERFVREIRTVAALQHPHILGLIDSGEIQGTAYYVMPFVEGESLRDRLRREKQLPIADAVRIATEVASALDYAHRHGVIHRDIKPENILLHDGQALVADFGIALAVSQAGGTRMTETGMSLGTPHYMSPEQAMGEREITARSDVYALGCVLYEMLSGDPPFIGSTAQAIVAKVLTDKPVPPRRVRERVPEAVDAAVLTALEKLPADRFATAAQLADALSSTGIERTRPVAVQGSAARRWPGAAVPILALLTAAIVAVLLVRHRSAPAVTTLPPTRHWSLVLPDSAPLAYIGGGTLGLGRLAMAVSPDGATLIYVGRHAGTTRLFRRQLSETTVTSIAGTEGAYDPLFSPDGQWIAFFVGPELRKVPAAGGTPVTLAQVPEPYGASWVLPDRILVTLREGAGLAWVSPSGGVLDSVPIADGAFQSPTILPDHRHALGTMWLHASVGPAAIDLGSGRSVVLTQRGPLSPDSLDAREAMHAGDPRFLPSGYLTYVKSGRLIAAPFDPATLAVTGPPVELEGGVRQEQGGRSQYVVTPDGTLIYAEGVVAGVARLVWVDRAGRIDTLPFAADPYGTFDLARDGRRMVTQVWYPASGVELRVLDLERGQSIHVATHGVPFSPRWWPDNRRIVFTERSTRPPYGEVTVRQLPGSVQQRDTLLVGWLVNEISPDTGRLEALGRSSRGPGLWLVQLGDTTRQVQIDPFPTVWGGTFSKDGRWIAYTSNEAGRYEIYVVRRDLTGERQKISVAGGEEPRWSPRGDELVYRWGQDWFAVPVPRAPSTEFGVPRRILTGPFINVADRSHDLGPDGRQLLLLGPREETTTRLEVVTGWLDQVRRLAPVAP